MDSKGSGRPGTIPAMISAVAWGSYGVFATLLLRADIREITLVALAPLALFVYFGIRILFKPQVLKEIPVKYCLGLFLLGLILFNGLNYSYAHAYSAGMPVGIVAIVAFCNVFVTMLESYFIFKYQITTTKIVSVLIAFLGLSMVLGLFGSIEGHFAPEGIMWTVLIPILFGTIMTLDKYFILKGVDADAIIFFMAMGAVSLVLSVQITPLELIRDLGGAVQRNPAAWVYVLGFCMIPHALCYTLTQESMQHIEPAVYSICYSLDPVTALILGALIFAQSIGAVQIAGVILVIAAVAYIHYKEGRAKTDPGKASLST